jgi:hypothetical protein
VRKLKAHPRFVFFDACYNGSFYEDDYLSGSYIFGEGNTIVAIGSTVNSLQDKWPDEFLGLLAAGMRVGQLNRHTGYLESHVIGDPTFHFRKDGSIDFDINEALTLHDDDAEFWKDKLDCPVPDVQAMALRQLWIAGDERASDIITQSYFSSPDFVVRMEAVKLLANHYPDQSVKVLNSSINDSYELIRRLSVDYAECNASPSLIPSLVLAFLTRGHERRLNFQLTSNLTAFDGKLFCDELNRQTAEMSRCVGQDLDELKQYHKQYETWFTDTKNSVEDKSLKTSRRISAVKSFRNYPNSSMIESLLKVASDETEDVDLRFYTIHSLGWFDTNYRRKVIIEGLKSIDTSNKRLKDEIRRSLSRLDK